VKEALIAVLLVFGIIGTVLYFGLKSDSDWESKCHNHGGHSIETHGKSSEICVSSDGRVIQW
jgi:hypothetical protein